MLRRIGRVFFIMGVIVVFGLLKNVLLARGLSKADFGLFNLILTLAGFIYPLSMLGQQNTAVRVFSKDGPQEYNWKQFFRKLIPIAFGISLGAAAGALFFYSLTTLEFLFLAVLICTTILAELYTYIFRAVAKYERAVFLYRSIRIALPLAVLLLGYLNRMEFKTILQVFIALHVSHAALIVFYTHRNVASGDRSLTRREYREGGFMLLSDLAALVIISIDKLLLAQLVDMESVGEYFAILAITRIFELASQSTDYVLIPHSNKVEHLKIKRMTFTILIGGSAVALFYVILGKPIIHYLYSGKYDSSNSLIPLFCVIGILQLLHVVPASVIRGRLVESALKTMTILDLILMVFAIVATYFFILKWQIIGALVATALIWGIRAGMAYAVLGKYHISAESQGILASVRRAS
jgi:O-antigen/teichoic acid export membrane protein